MLKKIKNLMLIASASALLLAPVAIPISVSASHGGAHIQDGLCKGANDLTVNQPAGALGAECAKTNTDPNSGTDSLNKLITQIINIISVIVAIVAVIMLIFGGFKYITSGGESTKVKSAKDTILYALIGLVIVALAQTVVKFVVNKLTG